MAKSTEKNNNNGEICNLGRETMQLLFFILCLVVFFYFTFNYLGIFTNYEQFLIETNSINPIIKAGNIVTVNTDYEVSYLKVTDVIACYKDISGDSAKEVVIRYIANISINEENERVFLTRRANAICQTCWDDWELLDCKIIGKYVFNLSILGKFFLFAKSDFGKFILIYNSIIICFIVKVFRYYSSINKRRG